MILILGESLLVVSSCKDHRIYEYITGYVYCKSGNFRYMKFSLEKFSC